MTARLNNGITAQKYITTFLKSSKIVTSVEIVLKLLVINYKETWYTNI